AALWAGIREARGIDGRDALWAHPDLVPDAVALDDPQAFIQGDSGSTPQFDAIDLELQQLLNGSDGDDQPDTDQPPKD
ncbi:MAG: zinc-dependent metalloprotease, partial [Propionibacterium sp.]|nr:zinc-dependent metalloprotease [Propionibacterium sp.]